MQSVVLHKCLSYECPREPQLGRSCMIEFHIDMNSWLLRWWGHFQGVEKTCGLRKRAGHFKSSLAFFRLFGSIHKLFFPCGPDAAFFPRVRLVWGVPTSHGHLVSRSGGPRGAFGCYLGNARQHILPTSRRKRRLLDNALDVEVCVPHFAEVAIIAWSIHDNNKTGLSDRDWSSSPPPMQMHSIQSAHLLGVLKRCPRPKVN